MLNQIENQWQTWHASVSARRLFRSWKKLEPCLNNWTLSELGNPSFKRCDTDDMQRAMVRLSQSGCTKASLALTCQLLPGLKKIAYTTAKGFREPQSEVLTSFYEVLIQRDLDRRPNKVAANLVLDTKQRVYRAAQRDMRHQDTVKKLAESFDWSHNPTETAIGHYSTKELLTQAIQTYSKPKERQVVSEIAFQHWVEGRPTKLISENLELSQTAVTTKLWRLRNKIRVLSEVDLN